MVLGAVGEADGEGTKIESSLAAREDSRPAWAAGPSEPGGGGEAGARQAARAEESSGASAARAGGTAAPSADCAAWPAADCAMRS